MKSHQAIELVILAVVCTALWISSLHLTRPQWPQGQEAQR